MCIKKSNYVKKNIFLYFNSVAIFIVKKFI